MKKPKCDLFSPDRFNIVSDIMATAAGVDPKKLGAGDPDAKAGFYEFVTKTAYASMIVHIGDALQELGYEFIETQ